MNTLLAILVAGLMIMAVVSLIRGIVAFMKTTKLDLESGEAEQIHEMQLKQNKMMFARIKYQAAAILVVALILAMAQ